MSGVASKGIPLSKEEVMILLHLIESNPAVTNKLTNSATNRLKEEAWKKITEAFNSMIKSCPRRPDQLKLKWENLKKSARKVIKLRLSRNRIGSSEPVYIPHFRAIKKIADILGISLNCSSNHDTIVFDDEGNHSLPSSNGLGSSPFGDYEDSSIPSGDIGDSSLSSVKNGESSISSVKNGDSSSTAGKNGNVCVSCGESKNARKVSKHEDRIITLAENAANSMEFDKNKDSGTEPIKIGVVSLNKSNGNIESIPSINTGNDSLAPVQSVNNSVIHGKDWAVSLLPVKSDDVSKPPMKTGNNAITSSKTIPSIKSVDVSMPSTKSGDISIPPIQSRNVSIGKPSIKDSIAPIQSGDVPKHTINSGNVSVSRKEDRDISGLCMKCGDNITKSEETGTDLEDGNVSCEDMDSQNEDAKEDSSPIVKSWGDLMLCEDDDDVTEQFEEDDNESSGDESVIAEDQKLEVHEIKINTSRTSTYGYHDAMADYYRAKTRKVRLEMMVLKAKLRLEAEKFKYEKRKLELELLQLNKK